jgi:NADPH2:quinone reductase
MPVKAVVCTEYGPPEKLVVQELPSLTAGAGQAVVAVKACGVNFPDTLIIEGKYQFKPPPPFSPGGEIAGVIKEVGPDVTQVKPGDAVIAAAPFGGYAEEFLVGASQVVPIPSGVDFVPAACASTAYGTVLYALRDRGQLKKGETLLVLGAAGGVGLAAVECGKLMGARVVAAGSGDKLEICKKYGADEIVDYQKDDLKQRMKQLGGADVVFDPVGGSYTEAALRSINWNGRLLVIGFAAGDIPKIPANLTLLKSCSVVGVFWGAWMMRDPAAGRALMEEILGLMRDGKLRPNVYATYPLDQAARALRDVLERRVQGKIAIVPGG